MKIGFKNQEWEKKVDEMFELYITMIKKSSPGTKEFNFASQMVKNHLDFMIYNRDIREIDDND